MIFSFYIRFDKKLKLPLVGNRLEADELCESCKAAGLEINSNPLTNS